MSRNVCKRGGWIGGRVAGRSGMNLRSRVLPVTCTAAANKRRSKEVNTPKDSLKKIK